MMSAWTYDCMQEGDHAEILPGQGIQGGQALKLVHGIEEDDVHVITPLNCFSTGESIDLWQAHIWSAPRVRQLTFNSKNL